MRALEPRRLRADYPSPDCRRALIDPVQQRLDGGRIDRLGHVMIEAGGTGSLDVLFLPPPGEGNQCGTRCDQGMRRNASASSYPFMPGMPMSSSSKYPGTVPKPPVKSARPNRRPTLRARDSLRKRARLVRVAVVVHDQDATHPCAGDLRLVSRRAPGTGCLERPWQKDAELAALSRPFAMRLDMPAVQLRQPARQGEADSQTSFGASARPPAPARTSRRSFGRSCGAQARFPSRLNGDDCDSAANFRASGRSRPRGSVYLPALVSRLVMICVSRRGRSAFQG